MAAVQLTQPASRPEPSSDTTELGAVLREARQSLKRELSDISDELRIKLSYLQAIEDGRLDDLPGPAYAVGFLRGYATYLGLDAEDIVNRFKAAGAVKGDRTELHLPSPVTDGRLPSAAVLIVAAVLAVCAYGTWYYVSSADRPREEKVAAVPPKMAESVNSVPAKPLPERGVLDPPAEVAASPAETAATRTESLELGAASGTQRPAAETRSAPSGSPATSRTAPETSRVPGPVPAAPSALKPTVETKPLPPVTQTTIRPAPEAAVSASPTVTAAPQSLSAELAAPPVLAPVPARARTETRREPPRPAATPTPVEPAASRTGTADAGPSVVVSSPDGSLPWLAPSDGTSPSVTDIVRSETTVAPAERASGRQIAEAETRQPAGRSRAAAPPRATDGATTPAALSTATSRQTSPDETDATGSVTTLQPSDEQVAMGRTAEGGRRISIHAKVDTWVEVRRGGGGPVFSKLMKAGEAFDVPAQPGFKLSTGNAAGIDLMVDGQRLSPLGKSGAVKKNVALDPEALLQSPGVAP